MGKGKSYDTWCRFPDGVEVVVLYFCFAACMSEPILLLCESLKAILRTCYVQNAVCVVHQIVH